MSTDRGRLLWRQCLETVDAQVLPQPFDAATFIGMLAESRGRPIDLFPVSCRPDIPCGLLITTDRADCILYAADTSPLHQQHILLHEAAHIICGHVETAPAAATGVLLPHLPPALVRRVLGRTVYTEPQEREAELVASLILTRVTHRARARFAPAKAPGPERSRLHTLFDTAKERVRGPGKERAPQAGPTRDLGRLDD